MASGDTLDCSVDVTNTGTRAGAEVAELYVGFPNSAVDRPVKLLRGFEKVRLQPGETRTVRFEVPLASLAYGTRRPAPGRSSTSRTTSTPAGRRAPGTC